MAFQIRDPLVLCPALEYSCLPLPTPLLFSLWRLCLIMYPVFLEFATLGQAIFELTEEGLLNYMYFFGFLVKSQLC